jgi:Zn-dependent protease
MKRPLLVFEDIHTTPRRKLFMLFGVQWMATPYAWLSLPFWCLLGTLTALVGERGTSTEEDLLIGLGYGVLLAVANAIHSLGHVFASKLVGAPMDAVLITATRNINLHLRDQSGYSKGIHISRSLGGPLLNIAAGLISFGIAKLADGGWLEVFALFNVVIGIFTLIPLPSLDGWVIWGELLGFRHRA